MQQTVCSSLYTKLPSQQEILRGKMRKMWLNIETDTWGADLQATLTENKGIGITEEL